MLVGCHYWSTGSSAGSIPSVGRWTSTSPEPPSASTSEPTASLPFGGSGSSCGWSNPGTACGWRSGSAGGPASPTPSRSSRKARHRRNATRSGTRSGGQRVVLLDRLRDQAAAVPRGDARRVLHPRRLGREDLVLDDLTEPARVVAAAEV